MSIHYLILNPETLSLAYQNKIEFSGVYCPFCRDSTNHKIKRYSTTRSLYYHLRLEHKEELSIEHVTSILHNLSYALELRMIK